MSGYIHMVVEFAGAHPTWAGLLVFLTAMAESIAVVGLFIPGTAILIGIGAIAGLGHLSLWEILIWAAFGAIVGDGISYWLGHRYGDRIRRIWPFSRGPELLTAGEAFIRRHGVKSVAIGRFVPALRAVVPLAAGVLGMPVGRFYVANVLSGIAWSPAHILPGALLGVSFGVMEGISARLAAFALALILLLALVAWLLRMVLSRIIVGAETLRRGIVARLRARPPHRFTRMMLDLLDPAVPAVRSVLFLGVVLAAALLGFLGLLEDVVAREEVVHLDAALSNFVQQMRMGWVDQVMVATTMLGDSVIAGIIALVAMAWLAWRRAWPLAGGIAVLAILTALFVSSLKWFLAIPRPELLVATAGDYSFPSGHASASAALYGTLAWFAFAAGDGQWRRWLTLLLGLLVGAIAASRIYLAAHWPSDVGAGLLFGLGLAAAFGLVYRKADLEAAHPRGLVMLCLATLAVAGAIHIHRGLGAELQAYAPNPEVTTMSETDWIAGAWRGLPAGRTDMEGEERQAFLLQWAGSAEQLAERLRRRGWSQPPSWSMAALSAMARIGTEMAALPVLPMLDNGRAPVAALVAPGAATDWRIVLRVWPSQVVVSTAGGPRPLLLGAITRERVVHPFDLLSLPRTDPGFQPAAGLLSAEDFPQSMVDTGAREDGSAVLLASPD